VWWTKTANDIPPEIVERFKDGKAMAIVGIEMDQVRKTPAGDVSVPINMAYNHHHDTAVVGSGSTMEELDRTHPKALDAKASGGGFVRLDMGKAWVPVEHTPSASGVATSAMFSDGNGGESRKRYNACLIELNTHSYLNDPARGHHRPASTRMHPRSRRSWSPRTPSPVHPCRSVRPGPWTSCLRVASQPLCQHHHRAALANA
jgi:hypothetical protein